MSEYYQYLSSMSMVGVGGQLAHNHPDVTGQVPQPPIIPMGAPPVPSVYQSLGYFTGFPEPIMFNAAKTQRSRRKSAPGLEHIKHRRTRSGCYTCRSRRVKCDETHPICERCRKGKRECVYPDPSQPKGSSGNNNSKESSAGPSQQPSPESSKGEDEEEAELDTKLETIMDEDEEEPESATSQTPTPGLPTRRSSTTSSLGPQRAGGDNRHGSETPSFEGLNRSSPALTMGTANPQTPIGLNFPSSSSARPDWTFLTHEMQFYLNYFYDNVTHYHYCATSDLDDFFRTILTTEATRNEALLYAVVAFSAYHHAMKDPNGRINEFLQFYSRSVRLLLECLKKKENYNIGTLLTILQLATIEEYLGDWINLMGHKKAAFEVLTQLYDPHSAMQSPVGRMAVTWYARFDVITSVMGCLAPSMSREWFTAQVEHYQDRATAEPQNVGCKFELWSARLRLIMMEMGLLYAKRAKRDISEDEYAAEHQRLAVVLEEWKNSWDPAMTDPSFLLTDLPTNNSDINPFTPEPLFQPPLFVATALVCEYHSLALMHASQSSIKLTDEAKAGLRERANAICRIVEAVEVWQGSPLGSLILLQACMVMASFYVRRDARHHMWLRRRYASLESMGYISPMTLRTRMAELFNDQSCVRWWLPNDEGFTPLLQSIRALADERNLMAASAQSETLQQIRHVFSRMQIGPDDGDTDMKDATA